jgi:hypothetical protein
VPGGGGGSEFVVARGRFAGRVVGHGGARCHTPCAAGRVAWWPAGSFRGREREPGKAPACS